jgi:hypothetical protein
MYNGRCIKARVASMNEASDARSNLDLAPLGKSISIQKHPYTGWPIIVFQRSTYIKVMKPSLRYTWYNPPSYSPSTRLQ